MRLSRIKLAGFKSFVDPTTIHLPGNLVGVVGPNGCGKSNVIDAVRWVMGESSAKHLRGDSMADVIFNGCASRKPVSTATIELIFDNHDGAIGGQYAQYSEVSIKRIVSRDGTSQYFLNNGRCRRKDITSIFLGTGLGPRSYAMIEQGMVSRLVEAKPDEMRVYIEEAAGISKYKERRRETENRIRHTRDNLDRLNDLREEVEKQIKHLQRQARQAKRYKKLKEKQRRLEAELLAIRLIDLDQHLAQHQRELSQGQTRLEAALAEQRRVESDIESARQLHIDATDSFNAAQARYYGVQSEISRLEQSIAHAREIRERQRDDLAEAESQLTSVSTEIEKDREQLEQLEHSLEQLVPDLDQAKAAEAASAAQLKRINESLDAWQANWHEFNLEAKEHQQTSEVERTRIEHLGAQLHGLRKRQNELDDETQDISIAGLEEILAEHTAREQTASEAVHSLTEALAEIDRQIPQFRNQDQELSDEIEELRGALESRRGRLEALEALQAAALGNDTDSVRDWLQEQKLERQPRLAQQLTVESPWQLAVETVLGDFLQALCVERTERHLTALPDGQLVMIDSAVNEDPTGADDVLLAKVEKAGSVAGILGTVRTAGDLDEALAIRPRLKRGQSVVTPDGVWLGHGWVRVNRGYQETGNLLGREQEIRELHARVGDLEQTLAGLESDRRVLRDRLQDLETQRADVLGRSNAANLEYAEISSKLAAVRQDYERTKHRLTAVTRDRRTLRDEVAGLEQALREAQARLKHAEEAARRLEERQPGLQAQQQELLEEYDRVHEQADQDRATAARVTIEYESRRASRESASTTLARVRSQKEQLVSRMASLSEQLGSSEEPLQESQRELEVQLDQEVTVERDLAERRAALEEAETTLRDAEAKRTECEKGVAEIREGVDSIRMLVREVEVRREGLNEQFGATGLDLSIISNELPEDADVTVWDENLAVVRRRIERLGAINLAAIDEFDEQSERKQYLDAQLADLTAALETLERAIRKIDRETRTRFQETFDNVNGGLKRIFPRLFGGGHAYLSLDGDDLLTAGVTVMARPPGKRISHIHLLSGGEKALTAVALIFSIFELNPAPFCLLDEVDAPLDDANVGRFCEIVREMSQNVQFIIITHNKTTMEMTSQLTGVTMNEPGVSRLVSVDIDEAVQLAAS